MGSNIRLERALTRLVASASERKVHERQQAPISVKEWLRLEQKRQTLAEAAETGVL